MTLLGRAVECAVFDHLIDDLRRGESRSLVLRGEAGIGKSALLEHLVASASDLTVEGAGVEAAADWAHLYTLETYLGYGRSGRAYHWMLDGAWTIESEHVVLERAGGAITCRFHARDAHLVLSSGSRGPVPFRVLLDGEPPGPSHGVDVDENGSGVLREARMYQLVRQRQSVHERTLEITFLGPGAEAYAFTFG